MTNGYFEHTDVVFNSRGRSQPVNDQLRLVEAGFDLLPDPTALRERRLTYAVDSGVAGACVATLSGLIVAYTAGLCVTLKVAATNTGTATLNVNGLGAKSIKRYDSSDLQAGDLLSSAIVELIYDGTQFRIISNLRMDDPTAETRNDGLWNLFSNGDSTKKLAFSLTGITTGNTRTITVPDASGTMVLNGATQTLTNKTFTNPTINGATISGTIAGAATFSGALALSNTLYGSSVVAQRKTGTVARAYGCGGGVDGVNGGFAFGSSKSMTVTLNNFYIEGFISNSDGKGAKFSTTYGSSTITLSADSDSNFVTGAPTAGQTQISKSTNSTVITFTNGITISATEYYLTFLCLITSITDPA